MNVYVEGDGPETIVILSGAELLLQSWTLECVSSYQNIKLLNRRRAGYGYIDDSNQSKCDGFV